MPRHPRIHAANTLYHIMARGNNGQPIFLNEHNYASFLEMLRTTKNRYPFKLYAYALMPNHIHMLIETLEKSSARIMQSLLTGYARYFNKAHKRRGHVFQGRYKAIMCQKDAYLMALMRYIHLNPVRAKLVTQPGAWVWSGHGEYTGSRDRKLIDHGAACEVFGAGALGRKKYGAFIAEGAGMGYIEAYHPAEHSPFLGNDAFVDTHRVQDGRQSPTMSIDVLSQKIAKKHGVAVAMVQGKSYDRAATRVRREIIIAAVAEHRHSQSAVARYLQCDPSYVSRVLQRFSHNCQV